MLLFSVPTFISSLAQRVQNVPPTVSVTTDKTSYAIGEPVVVKFDVKPVAINKTIDVQIRNPNKVLVNPIINPSANGSAVYSFQLLSQAPAGPWTITASYLNSSAEYKFDVRNQSAVINNPQPKIYSVSTERDLYSPDDIVDIIGTVKGSFKIPANFTLFGPSNKIKYEYTAYPGLDGFVTMNYVLNKSNSVGNWTVLMSYGSSRANTTFLVTNSSDMILGNRTGIDSHLLSSKIKIDKQTYNPGETLLLNGIDAHADNVTISVKNPLGQTILIHTLIPQRTNDTVPYSISIPKDSMGGNWSLEVEDGTKEKLNFQVNNLNKILGRVPNDNSISVDTTIARIDNNTLISFNNTGNTNVSSILVKLKEGNVGVSNIRSGNATVIDDNSVFITKSGLMKPGDTLLTLLALNNSEVPSAIQSNIGYSGAEFGPLTIVPFSATKKLDPANSSKEFTVRVLFKGDGKGSVSIDGEYCSSGSDSVCLKSYPAPNLVSIAAWAARDSKFDGWGAECNFPQRGKLIRDEVSSVSFYSDQVDTDRTCTVSFDKMPKVKLTIDVVGNGLGAVFTEPSPISCSTGAVGTCSAGFKEWQHISIEAIPASGSELRGWKGACQQRITDEGRPPEKIEIVVKSNSICTAIFDATLHNPPHKFPLVIPEFIRVSRVIADQAHQDLGWPVTPDNQSVYPFLHFQKFKSGDSPYYNSAEMYINPDGSTCVAISITPTKSPYWYDAYWAFDSRDRRASSQGWADTGFDTTMRQWTNDPRSFDKIRTDNRNENLWPTTYAPYSGGGHTSNPFLSYRGPSPMWYILCGNDNIISTSSIPPETSPSIDNSGFMCDFFRPWANYYSNGNGVQGSGPPAWAMIRPINRLIDADKVFPLGWMPDSAEGIVTNSFLSGHDVAEKTHIPLPGLDLEDYPTPEVDPYSLARASRYWLGALSPFYYTGEGSEGNCDHVAGLYDASGQLCNDWVGEMTLDPPYRHLLTTPNRYPNDNLVIELEQWLIPNGYRPEPGDRIFVQGRLIADCGEIHGVQVNPLIGGGELLHDDRTWAHTEIHPPELVVSSYLQKDAPIHPVNCNGVIAQCTRNTPQIAYEWERLAGNNPATIHKAVVTAYWQGGTLEYDLWPPPRPSENARLALFEILDRIDARDGISINVAGVPTENPNHFHVTITSDRYVMGFPHSEEDGGFRSVGSPCYSEFDENYCTLWGNVIPILHRRLVDSAMTWWTTPIISSVKMTLRDALTNEDITNSILPFGRVIYASVNIDTAWEDGLNPWTGPPKPTGDFKYERYETPDCRFDHVDEYVPVIGGKVLDSAKLSLVVSRFASYKGFYSGDQNYPPIEIPCTKIAEVLPPRISTTIMDNNNNQVTGSSLPVGSFIHVFAKITGGTGSPENIIPTGSLIYQRFFTTSTNIHDRCTGNHEDEPQRIVNGVVPKSSDFELSLPGVVSYRIQYNNWPADRASCQQVSVGPSS